MLYLLKRSIYHQRHISVLNIRGSDIHTIPSGTPKLFWVSRTTLHIRGTVVGLLLSCWSYHLPTVSEKCQWWTNYLWYFRGLPHYLRLPNRLRRLFLKFVFLIPFYSWIIRALFKGFVGKRTDVHYTLYIPDNYLKPYPYRLN